MGGERKRLRAVAPRLAPTFVLSREAAQEYRPRVVRGTVLRRGACRDQESAIVEVRCRCDIRGAHRTFAGVELSATPAIRAVQGHPDWRWGGESNVVRTD